MKLAVIVPFVDGYGMTKTVLTYLKEHARRPDTLLIAFGNGGERSSETLTDTNIWTERNVGSYGVFPIAAESIQHAYPDYDVIAVLHSDLLVYEDGYDDKILSAFEQDADLGLAGFVGSREIDARGGRGLYTVSNFMGLNGGSPAEVHGGRITGVVPAAHVDGCAMILRADVLNKLSLNSEQFPIHHFYDRLIACKVHELGYRAATIGVACDHLSNQTAGAAPSYYAEAKAWAERNLGIHEPQEWAAGNQEWMATNHYSAPDNWDMVMYLEAERRFLQEYRDQKHMVPFTV